MMHEDHIDMLISCFWLFRIFEFMLMMKASCCLNPSFPEVYMNVVAYYCFSCVRANTMLWCDLLVLIVV